MYPSFVNVSSSPRERKKWTTEVCCQSFEVNKSIIWVCLTSVWVYVCVFVSILLCITLYFRCTNLLVQKAVSVIHLRTKISPFFPAFLWMFRVVLFFFFWKKNTRKLWELIVFFVFALPELRSIFNLIWRPNANDESTALSKLLSLDLFVLLSIERHSRSLYITSLHWPARKMALHWKFYFIVVVTNLIIAIIFQQNHYHSQFLYFIFDYITKYPVNTQTNAKFQILLFFFSSVEICMRICVAQISLTSTIPFWK